MTHYFNITLLPDAELKETVLMNAVYTKLHKALFDLQSNKIGVSFPNYQLILGACMRIHGTKDDLEKLNNLKWLGGMSGYCKVSEILSVPENCQYRVISRKQANMSQSKLRRLQKRGSITGEEVKTYHAKMFAQGLDNPYLELQSSSNGNKHRRYLQFGELQNSSVEGDFDYFGLSKTATIPWF